MKFIAASALLLLPIAAHFAQSAPVPPVPSPVASPRAAKLDPWGSWRYFLGKWIGEGSGTPGQGSGGFSFKFELGETILVRRNHADYPATRERPAAHHEDLMILHAVPGFGVKAVYYDNEGHVIHYTATTESGDRWVFLSDPAPGPRFRLTYTQRSDDRVEIKFEMAGPEPDAPFKPYLTATAKRVK